MNTWVYKETDGGLFTVGFYTPSGVWHADSDHQNKHDAAKRVHYLNGGNVQETPNEILDSIFLLAEYLYDKEEDDFKDHEEELEDETHHIFYHVKRVLEYVNEQKES